MWVHTSANTGAVLCRVQALLRLLRWIDLRCLWGSPRRVRGYHHRCWTDQSHWGACTRAHQQRAALVIERDYLEWRQHAQGRIYTINNLVFTRCLHSTPTVYICIHLDYVAWVGLFITASLWADQWCDKHSKWQVECKNATNDRN